MEIVLKLLDWSLRQNWALGGPIVCLMVLMFIPALRNTADNPSDRAYWRDLLRHDRPAERYRSVMRKGLNWLDSRLSAHEAPQGPAQKAWSYGLLNATMALALAYPILAITIQLLCGSAIDFGGQEVMAASPPQARIFTAVWLGSSVLVYLFSGASKSRWRWTLVILATGILLLGLIFADGFAVPGNIAVAGTVAVASVGAGTVAFTGPVAFAGAVAGVGAVAFVVAATSAGTVAGAEERSSRPMARRLLFCGVLVALLIVAIKMPDDFGAGQRNQAVFFMLTMGVLPLVNAVFDFASVGLTRYLLRLGLEQKRAAWPAVLDGLGGIAIFFALGCTLIAFVTFVVPADGVPLVDLTQLFADMRRAPGDYIWLMVTLFSTLIPTLLHLSVAVLTLGLQYPAGVRNFVAGLLERGEQSGQAALLSGICICAMITIALWCPIWIFTFVITHDHGAIVNAVLWGFEAFAWAIGGI
ncbi:hypothetical protein [Planktomarina temperata]|uniref:Uncharacterized protein n=1 Tax=Planktomarina temperata RCA23 TaxID=666509 RepID=A0AAN0VH56_9RHOB|nr:hypothetical protein, transmembrane [Planktomarina temperata RCA23]